MSTQVPPPPEPPEPDKGDSLPSSTEMFKHTLPELRRIAGFITGRQPSMRPTDLVDRAWENVSARRRNWTDRSQFESFLRTVMQNLFLDHIRKDRRQKRGGKKGRGHSLDSVPSIEGPTDVPPIESEEELRMLIARIADLRRVNAGAADVIELVVRGLTTEQAAQALGRSVRSTERARRVGLAWMARTDPGDQQ